MICKKKISLYKSRVSKFKNKISKDILSDKLNFSAEFAHSIEPVYFNKRKELNYTEILEGEQWGKEWESAWFNLSGTVPKEWAGKKVVANLDFNGEALIFSDTGLPLQGLTNGSVFALDYSRDIYPLFEVAKGGEDVSLIIEAAANALFGINKEYDPPRNMPKRHGTYSGIVNKIRLCVFDEDLYQLWVDIDVLLNLYESLDSSSVRAARLLRGLCDVVNSYADDRKNTQICREILKPLLNQKANASSVTLNSVGHAHIDTAWLWPVRETIRKCARTFSNQISLINDYPNYVFGASQPQHYAMVKEHYPALYEKIKEAVAAGRWEPQGGMWVEADCNITSGESMARQLIHGKNFFKDEFDFDVKNLWIPDVFGYSSSMPQLMKRSGIDYFLTQKLSWSQFNEFPYTTFMWRGIDGSEILTHFPPENNYNSTLRPKPLNMAVSNFKEKEILDEAMVLFGTGNGGGGPKRNLLERAKRQEDLEGAPKVKFGRADEFFERLKPHEKELPKWNGELYLELHRGTLTTQARTKRGNRLLEKRLREIEYLFSCGELAEYPREALDAIWKIVLINQFHDIIPGSSIHTVYETTEREYAECLEKCDQLQQEATRSMFNSSENNLVLINTLDVVLNQPITLPKGWGNAIRIDNNEEVKVQLESDNTVVAYVDLAPQEIVTLQKSDKALHPSSVVDLILENEWVRYEFAENGEILRAYDKEVAKDILTEEKGNVLTLYEDIPINHDAWDIDIFYEEQALETAESIEYKSLGAGDARQGICFELSIGNSEITQKVYLNANSKRLDFVNKVNWNERHRMLRTSFSTTSYSEQATFDIQYGYVKRNTHRNTSWDMARFEVAAQKYMDLSSNNYGVAVLNDCKYGHKVLDNVMDLNLLRSPTNPDPDADLGIHEFTYSLLPHNGNLIESDVIREARQLNNPALLIDACEHKDFKLPVVVAGKGVALEVLKKAEKEECWVMRLVENYGCETVAKIKLNDTKMSLVECDLLEWNEAKNLGKGSLEFKMSPFEIRTFKIKLA